MPLHLDSVHVTVLMWVSMTSAQTTRPTSFQCNDSIFQYDLTTLQLKQIKN